MTDNEIIKALECCQIKKVNECAKCPYLPKISRNCERFLVTDALSLITRQKAEIERLTNAKYIFASVDYCSDDLAKVLEENERLKAEIENLKDFRYDADGVNLVNYWYQQCEIAENGCRNFEEENKKLKTEIERLRKENEILSTNADNAFQEGLNESRELFKQEVEAAIRVEAINEYVDRLTAELIAGGIYPAFVKGKIGKVKKEMEGDA